MRLVPFPRHVALASALLVLLCGSGARAQYLTNITLDGTSADWAGAYQYRDSAEAGIHDSRDINSVMFANNATYLFFSVTTVATQAGGRDIAVLIDVQRDTPSGGPVDADDLYVVLKLNGAEKCQSFEVLTAAVPQTLLATVGCETGGVANSASSGAFLEARVPLALLGLTASANVGVAVAFIPSTGDTDESPEPYPSTIAYANTGPAAPTFAAVRTLQAQLVPDGVEVSWSTSAEWMSAGTWVLRRNGERSWLPVSGEPTATEGSPHGGRYRVLDVAGTAEDEYALAEVDLRQSVTFYGPVGVEASSSSAQPVAARHARLPRPWASRGALAARDAAGLRLPMGQRSELAVQVHAQGVQVVCDEQLVALGWPANGGAELRHRGEVVPLRRVLPPVSTCAGLAFYAPAPASPYAPYDVYRLAPSSRALAAWPQESFGTAPAGARTHGRVTRRLTSYRYLDMGDAQPNRFFFGSAGVSFGPTLALGPGWVAADSDAELRVGARLLRPTTTNPHGLVVVAGGIETTVPLAGGGWAGVRVELTGDAQGVSLRAAPSGDPYEALLLGEVELSHRAALQLEDGSLWAVLDEAGTYAVSGGEAEPLLAVVASPRVEPASVTRTSAGEAFIQAPAGPLFVQTRASVATVQPSPVASAAEFDDPGLFGEYVVLAPAELLEVLEPLMELRRRQGLSVLAFSWDALYDRFTHSEPNPHAVRELLTWARALWAAAPRYLLLVGSTSFDPWGYQEASAPADAPLADFLLEGVAFRGWSDAALVTGSANAHYDDGVAVGRLPSSEASELEAYVSKVIRYETAQRASAGLDALLVAGRPTLRDPSFRTLAGLVGEAAGGEETMVEAHLPGAAARIGELWAHAQVVAYVGHGDSGSWSALTLLADDAVALRSAAPPVVLSAACMDGMFPAPNLNMAWALVSSPGESGATLAVSPTSLVDPNQAAGFLRTVMARTAGRTWGEAWAEAQRIWAFGVARSMSVIGDPALSTGRAPASEPVGQRLTISPSSSTLGYDSPRPR